MSQTAWEKDSLAPRVLQDTFMAEPQAVLQLA
jgi:hypothetical protein